MTPSLCHFRRVHERGATLHSSHSSRSGYPLQTRRTQRSWWVRSGSLCLIFTQLFKCCRDKSYLFAWRRNIWKCLNSVHVTRVCHSHSRSIWKPFRYYRVCKLTSDKQNEITCRSVALIFLWHFTEWELFTSSHNSSIQEFLRTQS